MGGRDTVSHLDNNTGLVTLGDGPMYTRVKRTPDTGDSHEGHLARKLLIGNFISRVEGDTCGGPRLKVPITERSGPRHLIVEDRP